MHRVVILFMFLSSNHVECTFYKENITDLSRCKVHFSKSEGTYNDFFQITPGNSSENLLFDFHFLVMAPSDAHILLTPLKTVIANSDPVYEIVLGAGRNTYSSIRRTMRGNVKATHRGNLLSAFEPRPFWIHVSKDGLIEIGRETQDVAFVSWRDPDPIPLMYFSLSTWPGIEAKWYYDCNKNAIKEIDPILTDTQRLMHDYVIKYPIYEIPILSDAGKIDVSMKLQPLFMQLNEKEGKLESRFLMTQKWIDPKLSWLPKEYGGIESLNLWFYDIWTPNMRIFSVIDEFDRTGSDTKLFVAYDGKVTYKANLLLKTWCYAAELDDWPDDRHVCKFPIGFFIDSNKINLNLESNIPDGVNLKYKTEWDIQKVDHFTFLPETNEQPNLEIIFYLKRISTVYKLIYSTPLIVIAVGTLLSFWVSPFGYLKMVIASLNLFLVTIVLVQMASYIPGHPENVPKLILAYNCAYFGIVISIVVAVLVINLSRGTHKYHLPRCLSQMVLNRTMQKALFLTIPRNFMESPVYHSWILLAYFIDRLSFVIYVIFCGTGLYIFMK